MGGECAYLSLAQFRTCLWSCVGWWASGQEAGQPPESELALDTPNRQPEAKTGAPRSQRGTRLKATTNGLFWSRWPSKGQHRRGLFIIARRADGVSPSNPRQHRRVKSPSPLLVSPSHEAGCHLPSLTPDGRTSCSSEFQSGGSTRPPLNLWWGERHDSAHP
jgi:hypothetical protein